MLNIIDITRSIFKSLYIFLFVVSVCDSLKESVILHEENVLPWIIFQVCLHFGWANCKVFETL